MPEQCVSDIACITFPNHIPCHIDLIERIVSVGGQESEAPFALISGRRYNLDFKYKVGFPASNAFGAFFYLNPEDALRVLRQIDPPDARQIRDNQPSVNFWPVRPERYSTAIDEQTGTMHVQMPVVSVNAGDILVYYGVLAMYQPDEEET